LVIPAPVVNPLFQWILDFRLRGSDGFRIVYDSIKKMEPKETARVLLLPARRALSRPLCRCPARDKGD
jgi:hypothetical protein